MKSLIICVPFLLTLTIAPTPALRGSRKLELNSLQNTTSIGNSNLNMLFKVPLEES